MIYSEKFENNLIRKNEEEVIYRLKEEYVAVVRENPKTKKCMPILLLKK